MAVVISVDGAVKLLGFVRLKVRTEDYLWLMSDNQCPMTLTKTETDKCLQTMRRMKK